MESPQRTLPRSLLISTLAVTVMYLLLNAVFLFTTPTSEMTGKVEIGLIAANHIFGPKVGSLMGIAVALLLLSSISSMIFVGPRVSCRMGEDHPLLRFLKRRSSRGIPVAALVLQYALSLVMILTGSFRFITEYTGILLSLCALLTVLGVFRHRRRYPSAERPVRTPLYPVTPVLFAIPILISVVYLCLTNWMNLAVSAGILLLGVLVYWIELRIYK
jgi:APA family basic amino acid/polyamine antiporter